MLILLPPSEGKTQRRRGRPLDLGRLSFPELNPMRQAAIDAVAELSARPDAHERLRVGPSLLEEVARNTRLRVAPTAPAGTVYTGVLFAALGLDSLDPAATRRANRRIVILSALFGAVRPTDRIPAYRLHPCVRLPGLDDEIGRTWRPRLAPVLQLEAGRRLVVDCRSSTYVALWKPTGELGERRVQITVPGASHHAKHTRGLVARRLVQSPEPPRRPDELAELLSDTFEVDLTEPRRPGHPWLLAVISRGPASRR